MIQNRMEVFVDTSAFLAIFNIKDINHTLSINIISEIQKENKCFPVTSNMIIYELLNGIKKKTSNETASLIATKIYDKDFNIPIIKVTDQIEYLGLNIYTKYLDKSFSFTDCCSFALMKERKINLAFGFDNHFKQFGFELFHEKFL
jgi:uncharacterized protein